MAAAAAVVTPSGLQDRVARSRGEGAGEAVVERGPGAAYHMFVVMEYLVEKLKLLHYEEGLLRKSNLKPPSRHYFALPTNPGEQFYMFCTLAAWLINKAGHPFEQPQEYDDPNATISNILSELRSFGRTADFPPSKLKSGYGEHVCYILDCLAEEALKYIGFTWKRPSYPVEEVEEEAVPEDDAELTLNKVDEEFVEEETDNEENFIDLNILKAQTYHLDMSESAKQEDILESTTDAAEWSLEVERVLPQLKVTIRTDNKARERYQQGSGGVTERTRLLAEVTEELEKVKQEMEEKGSSMTDGAPLVKIKQSLTKLKQETIQMDIRIGVVEHTLLQSKLKEKSNMTRDMHATIIPESTIGSY
ncbi:intraflagellar transport protein 57 homolog isoform X2 [Fukomys damarensis]|uniref:intraflagellar transport protein 57 homolog isoform X2 n=1 Tax=Fukomys damarensis TaxID=885580 RepID=UPI0014556575|nr:intraflagellar transport protein 57 homolog isoform X2 [Fukomys damarensis]